VCRPKRFVVKGAVYLVGWPESTKKSIIVSGSSFAAMDPYTDMDVPKAG